MDNVSHQGFVEKVAGDKATVRIISQSACSACKSKGACSISEMKEKIVEVQLQQRQAVKEGDQVDVVIAQKQGDKAVVLAYAVPMALFVGLLVLVSALHGSELLSGVVALGGIGLYFLVLHLFRRRIEGQFMFHLK